MDGAFPVYGTGEYFAANGAGIPGNEYVPQVATTGAVAASFDAYGTGVYFAAASGTGIPSDPYVPLVSIV